MNDVLIKYWELERLVTRLTSIIEEFETAGDRSDEIREKVGYPWGKTELTDKASEAESRWSYKRGKLTESLTSFRDAAQGIYESFQSLDEEAASAFEEGQDPPAQA